MRVAEPNVGGGWGTEAPSQDIDQMWTPVSTFAAAIHSNRAIRLAGISQLAAEADIVAGLRLAPSSPCLHALLGRMHAERADYDSALVAFNRALDLDPDLVVALTGRAALAYRSDDRERALVDLERAIELAPDDPTPRFGRALILQEMGRWDAALVDLDIAASVARDRTHGPLLTQRLRQTIRLVQNAVEIRAPGYRGSERTGYRCIQPFRASRKGPGSGAMNPMSRTGQQLTSAALIVFFAFASRSTRTGSRSGGIGAGLARRCSGGRLGAGSHPFTCPAVTPAPAATARPPPRRPPVAAGPAAGRARRNRWERVKHADRPRIRTNDSREIP
jgi:hypothetical protein